MKAHLAPGIITVLATWGMPSSSSNPSQLQKWPKKEVPAEQHLLCPRAEWCSRRVIYTGGGAGPPRHALRLLEEGDRCWPTRWMIHRAIALALDGRPGVGWRGGTKQRSGIEAKMLQWDSLSSNPSSPASITYYLWDIGKCTSLLLPQFLHRQNVDDNSTYLIGAIVRIKWAEMGDVLSTLHVISIINCLLSGIYSKSY